MKSPWSITWYWVSSQSQQQVYCWLPVVWQCFADAANHRIDRHELHVADSTGPVFGKMNVPGLADRYRARSKILTAVGGITERSYADSYSSTKSIELRVDRWGPPFFMPYGFRDWGSLTGERTHAGRLLTHYAHSWLPSGLHNPGASNPRCWDQNRAELYCDGK